MQEPALDPRFEYDFEGRMVWRRRVPQQIHIAMASSVGGLIWFFSAEALGIPTMLAFLGVIAFPVLSWVTLIWGIVQMLVWPRRYKGWAMAAGALILTAGMTLLTGMTIDYMRWFHGPS